MFRFFPFCLLCDIRDIRGDSVMEREREKEKEL